MNSQNQEIKGASVTDQLIERIKRMTLENQEVLLHELDGRQDRKRRQHDRKTFFMSVDYVVQDRYFRDFIQDVSDTGVFIKTSQNVLPGQQILMTFMSPDNQKPFKISGDVVRVTPEGIGVKFIVESQVQAAVIKSLVQMIKSD
ncbi:MAG: PilZ domain-containing protein [Desulfobacterales bacterium]|nr:MAG: PilZ domain-containing protein [Desulfobacterales bacterium]UCD89289.1 MAG: PilZ domain-containing protein [Desulfobacterales bacterium]